MLAVDLPQLCLDHRLLHQVDLPHHPLVEELQVVGDVQEPLQLQVEGVAEGWVEVELGDFEAKAAGTLPQDGRLGNPGDVDLVVGEPLDADHDCLEQRQLTVHQLLLHQLPLLLKHLFW